MRQGFRQGLRRPVQMSQWQLSKGSGGLRPG